MVKFHTAHFSRVTSQVHLQIWIMWLAMLTNRHCNPIQLLYVVKVKSADNNMISKLTTGRLEQANKSIFNECYILAAMMYTKYGLILQY